MYHCIASIIDLITQTRDIDIVMEYAAHGDLAHFIKTSGPIYERRAATISFQCAAGLAFLHSRNIIHRDIKPSVRSS